MSSDDESVTSSLRHRDVELIERLSDVIDTRNSSATSNERISLNELINFTDYSGFRPAQVQPHNGELSQSKEAEFILTLYLVATYPRMLDWHR